jgi:hypothetical protein
MSLNTPALMDNNDDLGMSKAEDYGDIGHVPAGMEVNHPDDDEGGEGFDGSKDEEKEEDDDEPGMVDKQRINANHDAAEALDENDDDDEEDGADEDEDDEDEDEDDEDDDDDDEDNAVQKRPRKKVCSLYLGSFPGSPD